MADWFTQCGVPVRTWMAPREDTMVKTLDDHHNPRQLDTVFPFP